MASPVAVVVAGVIGYEQPEVRTAPSSMTLLSQGFLLRLLSLGARWWQVMSLVTWLPVREAWLLTEHEFILLFAVFSIPWLALIWPRI
jgi:UDP-N-acetyl-D-mannosaminuronic acid transferase (WecB/TagA/CpsF family)